MLPSPFRGRQLPEGVGESAAAVGRRHRCLLGLKAPLRGTCFVIYTHVFIYVHPFLHVCIFTQLGKLQRAQSRSPLILVAVGNMPKQAFIQELELLDKHVAVRLYTSSFEHGLSGASGAPDGHRPKLAARRVAWQSPCPGVYIYIYI